MIFDEYVWDKTQSVNVYTQSVNVWLYHSLFVYTEMLSGEFDRIYCLNIGKIPKDQNTDVMYICIVLSLSLSNTVYIYVETHRAFVQ